MVAPVLVSWCSCTDLHNIGMCGLPSCACSEKSQPWKWNALIHCNRVPIHRTSTFMLGNVRHIRTNPQISRSFVLFSRWIKLFYVFVIFGWFARCQNKQIQMLDSKYRQPVLPPREHDLLCLISFSKSFLTRLLRFDNNVIAYRSVVTAVYVTILWKTTQRRLRPLRLHDNLKIVCWKIIKCEIWRRTGIKSSF